MGWRVTFRALLTAAAELTFGPALCQRTYYVHRLLQRVCVCRIGPFLSMLLGLQLTLSRSMISVQLSVILYRVHSALCTFC